MRWIIPALVGIITYAGGAFGAEDNACLTAASLVHADFPLTHVATALKNKQLDIVVVGSTSSILAGATKAAAYPIKLEAALAGRLQDIKVKVTSFAKPRQTAADMEKDFAKILMDAKPALVIWQTGTVEAIRGIDLDEFRATLDVGVDTLHNGHADVVLMNMQYSPRTDTMIAAASYADVMRWVGLQREVPLFDRLAIMRQWYELGTFDLYAATKNTDMAERVHGCLGQLLADLVIDSAKLAEVGSTGSSEPKDIR
jgi:hypothetical protein